MHSIFSKDKADGARLANELRKRPLDPSALTELKAILVAKHTELQESLLWKVLSDSEKALQVESDKTLLSLLTEIHQSANWEVQTRCRAT